MEHLGKSKSSALLQAAAATHEGKDFARNMAHGESALLKAVMMALVAVVSAFHMVATGSALGNGATRPLNLEEGARSTCTPRKNARLMVARVLS